MFKNELKEISFEMHNKLNFAYLYNIQLDFIFIF